MVRRREIHPGLVLVGDHVERLADVTSGSAFFDGGAFFSVAIPRKIPSNSDEDDAPGAAG